MSLAVVIGAHENSEVLNDTIQSVRRYLTEDVLVVVDGFGFGSFPSGEGIVRGFPHGRISAPFRNVALGLKTVRERFKADWYCYMEYDCLVGGGIEEHLKSAEEKNWLIFGNDYRRSSLKIPFLNNFAKEELNLHYLLGCCMFFNSYFMEMLERDDFFERFLTYTNFYNHSVRFTDGMEVYDVSEFLYPSFAVRYGGVVGQLAVWADGWKGNTLFPMRFRPDLTIKDPYENSCIMHPVKTFGSPLREFHRRKRNDR